MQSNFFLYVISMKFALCDRSEEELGSDYHSLSKKITSPCKPSLP